MQATVAHLPSTATADEIHEVLARDGAVVVDNLVDPAAMDAVLAEMEPWIEATPAGPDSFSGMATKRTGALVARSETSRDLVMHPLILGITEKLLARATSFQLHLTQIISIGPGEPAQPIHRDQWAFDFFEFPNDYDVQCNTIWAMTDFTEENGATRLVLGSNTAEDKLKFDHEESVPAEMTKGSVLLYTGKVYHGGGANNSDMVRRGINITYNVSWLRQEENQYLSVPLDVARDLPEDLQRMIGYARGAYALGYIDDIRDPLVLLNPDLGATGFGDETTVPKIVTS